jgi:circadian clock protein KaiC
VRAKARGFGLDIEALEGAGHLRLVWRSQAEHLIDELGHRLLEDVAAHGAKRLVIDGLSGFFESATHPERVSRFFSCLVNELRRRGVTVLMTLETVDVVGTAVPTAYGVSGFIDNLLFLRFVESQGRIKRLLTITKMRDSDFHPGQHAVEIDASGMRIAGIYSSGGDVIPSAEPVTTKPSTSSPTGPSAP